MRDRRVDQMGDLFKGAQVGRVGDGLGAAACSDDTLGDLVELAVHVGASEWQPRCVMLVHARSTRPPRTGREGGRQCDLYSAQATWKRSCRSRSRAAWSAAFRRTSGSSRRHSDARGNAARKLCAPSVLGTAHRRGDPARRPFTAGLERPALRNRRTRTGSPSGSPGEEIASACRERALPRCCAERSRVPMLLSLRLPPKGAAERLIETA